MGEAEGMGETSEKELTCKIANNDGAVEQRHVLHGVFVDAFQSFVKRVPPLSKCARRMRLPFGRSRISIVVGVAEDSDPDQVREEAHEPKQGQGKDAGIDGHDVPL